MILLFTHEKENSLKPLRRNQALRCKQCKVEREDYPKVSMNTRGGPSNLVKLAVWWHSSGQPPLTEARRKTRYETAKKGSRPGPFSVPEKAQALR